MSVDERLVKAGAQRLWLRGERQGSRFLQDNARGIAREVLEAAAEEAAKDTAAGFDPAAA